jgi:hypothetical protein
MIPLFFLPFSRISLTPKTPKFFPPQKKKKKPLVLTMGVEIRAAGVIRLLIVVFPNTEISSESFKTHLPN